MKKLFFFLLLTLLTQVGGLTYLVYQPISGWIKKYKYTQEVLLRIIVFLSLYLFVTFLVIPPIAKQFGRVPLPYFATKKTPIKPLTIFTCLLNRNYVKPILKNRILLVSSNLEKEFPTTKLAYLDANFPFLAGFPLWPHLSHNDGKKLDLAFFYKDAKTGKSIYTSPSFYGYGVFENPKKKERNQPYLCQKKGYWQYSFMEKITPQWYKEKRLLDEKITKRLLQLLIKEQAIKKIFLEPHLKNRWGFKNVAKIRYHGCHAVRHDDHIHVQL